MNIAIIGAGNVAWHISKAFIKAGYPVKQIWSRNTEKATNLAMETGANSIANLNQLSDGIDLVVLTVSDDAILEVAKQLNIKDNQVLVHTSGSTSIDVLKPYAKQYGVIYPLQTFSKDVAVDFLKVPVCIEGNTAELTQSLLSIAQKASSNTQIVNSEQRLKLHVAAVFASNFTNYFYTIAEDYIADAGLSVDIIKPLIEATSQKVLNGNPKALQTGPARRNDKVTMNKHLEILSANTELKEIYGLISQNIVKMYNQK